MTSAGSESRIDDWLAVFARVRLSLVAVWLSSAWPRAPMVVMAEPIWLAALSMLPIPDSMAPRNFCLATASPSIGVFSAVIIWPRVSSTFWV
ncbi:hypothetical protein D3C76_1282220 [compost metagenome]